MWNCIRTRPRAGARARLPALLVAAVLWPAAVAGQVERGDTVLGQPVGVAPELGVAPGAEAPATLPAWAAASIQALERRLAADAAADDVGSIAAAVVVNDSVVWQAAFGRADRETGSLAGVNTLYRAGSISKSITALVLLALVERGDVALDDPVEQHLPELRRLADASPDHRPITFRDLASHTAGLAREPATSHAGRGPVRDWRRKLIAALPATSVVAPPGTGYRYSNIGYALLGLGMERAAGRSYEKLVQELVLDPLGMTSSYLIVPGAERRRLATGYVNPGPGFIDPRVPRAEHRGRGYRVPNDGLYATVGDLARLAMAMTGALGDIPIRAESRADALTDQVETPTAAGVAAGMAAGAAADRMLDPPAVGAVDGTGYGLGFQLHRIGDTVIAGHSGTVAGYTAYLAFDPATRVGVVLVRSYNHGATNLGATAARAILDLGLAVP